MQPQHPAQIRITENGPWQQAKMVHHCRDGRWLAALDDGSSVYAADVRINHDDAAAYMQSIAAQLETLGAALRHVPVSARTPDYYDACMHMVVGYGHILDVAQQLEMGRVEQAARCTA